MVGVLLADAMKIQPHELLMHPADAMALRQQMAAALELANSVTAPSDGAKDEKRRA